MQIARRSAWEYVGVVVAVEQPVSVIIRLSSTTAARVCMCARLKFWGWRPWQPWSVVEWCGHRIEEIPVPTVDGRGRLIVVAAIESLGEVGLNVLGRNPTPLSCHSVAALIHARRNCARPS